MKQQTKLFITALLLALVATSKHLASGFELQGEDLLQEHRNVLFSKSNVIGE